MERIPLMNIQKNEVYENWCENALEDNYHRKRLLKEYCQENDCDLVNAIEYIISNIEGKIFASFRLGRYINEYLSEVNQDSIYEFEMLNINVCKAELMNMYTEFKEKREFKKGKDNECGTNLISYIFTERDVEFLTKWKEDILADEGDKINNNNSIIPKNKQSLGKLNESEILELYNICNLNVFKYCTLETFVNSLNNPQECTLEVKKNSLLYVLYTWFTNIFDGNSHERIKQLNDKFGITEETYRKKKSLSNKSEPQKKFEKKLQAVWDVN